MMHSYRAFPSGKMQGPYFGKVIESEIIETGVQRWKYELEVVETAEDNWEDFDVASTVDDVLNVFESGNTSSTSMGIAHTQLPGTYELKPCPTGTVVPFWFHPNGSVMMWPNQFDGTC